MSYEIPHELIAAFADAPALLTVAQAAKLLNMSRPGIYGLCYRAGLRHYRLGGMDKGMIRIAKDDLAALVKARQVRLAKRRRKRPAKPKNQLSQ
ncbi:MAG TPA: helix-turn-helix domain-containing protein [Pirellulales bacterium]|jgi:excisionase family DNA binding protein